VSDDSIQPATLIKTEIKIVEYQIHKTTQQQIESLRNIYKKKKKYNSLKIIICKNKKCVLDLGKYLYL